MARMKRGKRYKKQRKNEHKPLISKLPDDMTMECLPLIPKLPDDMAMECLVRVSLEYETLNVMKKVCKTWRSLLSDYNSEFYTERRRRNLQQPSFFLVPCMYFYNCDDAYSDYACVPHNSKIFILGGSVNEESVTDFWIVDTFARTVTKGPDMIQARQDFVGVVINERLYAIGGQYVDLEEEDRDLQIVFLTEVEYYDFASAMWVRVSPLPIGVFTFRCYVDTFSSTTTKLFVSGIRDDGGGVEEPVTLSYCLATDKWTQIEDDDESLFPSISIVKSFKWMFCSGRLWFMKEFLRCKKDGDKDYEEVRKRYLELKKRGGKVSKAVWQFPRDISVLPGYIKWLTQPTKEEVISRCLAEIPTELTMENYVSDIIKSRLEPHRYDEDDVYYKRPLFLEYLNLGPSVFTGLDKKTKTAKIDSDVWPGNVIFLPHSVLAKVDHPLVCEIIATNTMKDAMRFTNRYDFGCKFAILFF